MKIGNTGKPNNHCGPTPLSVSGRYTRAHLKRLGDIELRIKNVVDIGWRGYIERLCVLGGGWRGWLILGGG